jgi:hypothetical protein
MSNPPCHPTGPLGGLTSATGLAWNASAANGSSDVDIARAAEEIVARYLREVNPSEGVVAEAAEENDASSAWVVMMRPKGLWVYMMTYVPEEGWMLCRVPCSREAVPSSVSVDDIDWLGVHKTKAHAAILALTMMEDQP